jgi:hypothetical protein
MKYKLFYSTVLVLTILLTAFSSCVSSQFPFPVKGSGELKDKSYNISSFNNISVAGGFDVVLIQGNNEGVVLSAQENLFEYITVKVEEGVLKIYTEKNIMPTKGLKATISLKSISGLKVSGGGDVSSETGLDVPKLAIELSGGGDLSTNLKTDEMDCRISGGGDANIDGTVKNYNLGISGGGDVKSDVSASIVDCSISGGGNLEMKSRDKISNANFVISGGGDLRIDMEADLLKCSISGGGDAALAGRAGMLDISVGGGGDINAGRLAAQTAKFNASGGSDVHVNATNELSGYISGGGNLYYSGNPAIKNIEAKGGSEVRKE